MNLNYISESRRGLVREVNQDHAGTLQTTEGFLAVVCDGVGGNNGGETASEIAVGAIISGFRDYTELEPIERIEKGIRIANEEIAREADLDPFLKGMATTAVVLFLDHYGAYWAHAGDSRIYFYKDSELTQLTKDHSLVQTMVDKGIINAAAAEKHPFKHIITRAIGENLSLEIETGSMDLNYDENIKFLLCSDGVSGMLTKVEIADILSMNNLSEMDIKFTRKIEKNGAVDNYTFIIISNK
jgi:protein phosphatase